MKPGDLYFFDNIHELLLVFPVKNYKPGSFTNPTRLFPQKIMPGCLLYVSSIDLLFEQEKFLFYKFLYKNRICYLHFENFDSHMNQKKLWRYE